MIESKGDRFGLLIYIGRELGKFIFLFFYVILNFWVLRLD